MLGGRRLTELVDTPGPSSTALDLVTRRALATVPDTATDVQTAGRYLAWTGEGTRGYPPTDVVHVINLETGRQVYSLDKKRISDAMRDPISDDADTVLSPTGSLDLEGVVAAGARARPVAIDSRGHIHRLRIPLRSEVIFTTRLRGSRVALDLPQDTCHGTGHWITTRTGRTANDLRIAAADQRSHEDSSIAYLGTRTILWTDSPGDTGPPRPDRLHVIPDVTRLPLTRQHRPVCDPDK